MNIWQSADEFPPCTVIIWQIVLCGELFFLPCCINCLLQVWFKQRWALSICVCVLGFLLTTICLSKLSSVGIFCVCVRITERSILPTYWQSEEVMLDIRQYKQRQSCHFTAATFASILSNAGWKLQLYWTLLLIREQDSRTFHPLLGWSSSWVIWWGALLRNATHDYLNLLAGLDCSSGRWAHFWLRGSLLLPFHTRL